MFFSLAYKLIIPWRNITRLQAEMKRTDKSRGPTN